MLTGEDIMEPPKLLETAKKVKKYDYCGTFLHCFIIVR